MFNHEKLKWLVKRYKFSQEELKVVPKGKCLVKRCRFSQKELEVVSKGKGLVKRYKFSEGYRLAKKS
jgi:hypothetical protein